MEEPGQERARDCRGGGGRAEDTRDWGTGTLGDVLGDLGRAREPGGWTQDFASELCGLQSGALRTVFFSLLPLSFI